MSYGTDEWQPWILNEAESLPLLEHAYKCGINTWDTVSTPFHSPTEFLTDVPTPRQTSTPTAARSASSAKR